MWRVSVVVKCKNGKSPTVFRRNYLRETQDKAREAGERFYDSIEQTGLKILDSDIQTEKA